MSKGYLVPVPVTSPPKRSVWRLRILALALLLLIPAASLLLLHTSPDPVVGNAVVKPEPVVETKQAAAPPPAPVSARRVEAERDPNPAPLPLAAPPPLPAPAPRAAPESTKADVAILPPPRPKATELPVLSGPVPAKGWILQDDAAPPTPGDAGGPRVLIRHVNRDIDGGDYRVVKNTGLSQCESQCKADQRCRAYTFNTWQNVCFLKSSTSVMRIEPRGVSGVLETVDLRSARRPPTIQRLSARQFPGVPYRVFQGSDYDACARQCLVDPLCLGFNISRLDRSCALLSRLDRSVPGNGTEAGMKLQTPVVASAAQRRRTRPPRSDMPPEAAAIFDAMVRQMRRF
jgi:PAN domain